MSYLPIDIRTCRDRQDGAIAALESALATLDDRVSAMEAMLARMTPAIIWTGTPPIARTATVGQTYSHRPGDWVDQYCAAVDGPDPEGV